MRAGRTQAPVKRGWAPAAMATTTWVPAATIMPHKYPPMHAVKKNEGLRVFDESLRALGNMGARTFSCDLTAWSNARQRLSCLKSGENVTNNETP